MKKFALVALLVTFSAIAARAQESRQDISVSGSVMLEPYKSSSTDVKVSAKRDLGGLVSYRFMLTPRGAVEGNWAMTQGALHYITPVNNYQINTRVQEASA